MGYKYDNSRKVEKIRLGSEIGNILEDPDPEVLKKLKGRYKINTLHEKEYIVTEFPYRGKLSIMMGIMKVYPALNRFLRE